MSLKHIIISGTSKAATTSVFEYLADHHQIKPSYIKQTNYFLEAEIQKRFGLTSIYKFNNSDNQYFKFFKTDGFEDKVFLEASPDYMYYGNTLKRIAKFSKHKTVNIIIILREPVSRMVSWFNFGKQQGILDETVDFKTFSKLAIDYRANTNLCLMSYETGFYSKYLKTLFSIIDRENVYIYFYEDLRKNPKHFMGQLCKDFHLDTSFYDNYSFGLHNTTVKIKSKLFAYIYDNLRAFYVRNLYKGKIGVLLGASIKRIISPIYKKANSKAVEKDLIDTETLNFLKDLYKEEKKELELILDKKTPWE